MDLSIVIVSWNTCDLLRDNLKSIFDSNSKLDFEVLVVDNHSQDGTVQMIAQEFPSVSIIANNYNAGFSAANNQAIAMAQGFYVLLLNPDMRVLPSALDDMFAFMNAHPETGIAGCRLFGEDGKTVLHVRRFPNLLDQLAIVLKLPHLFPKVLNKYLMRNFDYEKQAEVDSIRGSFFMIRRELIQKIGGLDERYFVWFEEVDYCKQAREAGFKVMYNPDVKCIDYVGKSFSQVKRGKTQKYFKNSMLVYFKKWKPFWQYLILLIAWPAGIFLTWIADKINFKSKGQT